MVSAAPTDLETIWGHAKNVRKDFIQNSRYLPITPNYVDIFGGGEYYDYDSDTEAQNDKSDNNGYYDNSDSKDFINQDNIEENYEKMYNLMNSSYTDDLKNINSISKNDMKNGALLFVFLNSNPKTSWREYWVELFDIILKEEPYKSVLMTNEVLKNSSPIEKEITTNFLAKLASVFEFQHYLPLNYDNPLVTSNFSIGLQDVEGFSFITHFSFHQ